MKKSDRRKNEYACLRTDPPSIFNTLLKEEKGGKGKTSDVCPHIKNTFNGLRYSLYKHMHIILITFPPSLSSTLKYVKVKR
jgi:hypothetical protein